MSNAFWKIDLPSAVWMRHNLPWLAFFSLLFSVEKLEARQQVQAAPDHG